MWKDRHWVAQAVAMVLAAFVIVGYSATKHSSKAVDVLKRKVNAPVDPEILKELER